MERIVRGLLSSVIMMILLSGCGEVVDQPAKKAGAVETPESVEPPAQTQPARVESSASSTRRRTAIATVYFYDIATGELFAADRAAQPPIDAPSGPGNGVKAIVYACGVCEPANMRVAFLTTYSPEARAAMKAMMHSTDGDVDLKLVNAIETGTLVASPAPGGSDIQWVSAMSLAGITIMGRAGELCGNEPAKPCFPD